GSFRYTAARLTGKLKLFGFLGTRDFSTDPGLFKDLIEHLPKSAVKVAESGVKPNGISQVRDLGFDCALIGTALLKSPLGVRQTLDAFAKAMEGGSMTDDVAVDSASAASA